MRFRRVRHSTSTDAFQTCDAGRACGTPDVTRTCRRGSSGSASYLPIRRERVPDVRRRTRRSASTIGGGTPDMTIGRAAADQAGARPYLHRYAGTRSTRDASAGPYKERIHVHSCAPSTCNAPYLINCPRYSLVSYTKVTLPSTSYSSKRSLIESTISS